MSTCACSGKSLARLLRPAVLALLAREEMHGYVLLQRLGELAMFSDALPDTSGVYKTLKVMEEEGLVSSSWELGDSGPAKRRYALTKEGKACLKRWGETLEAYRTQIDGLLCLLESQASEAACKRGTKCNCRKD